MDDFNENPIEKIIETIRKLQYSMLVDQAEVNQIKNLAAERAQQLQGVCGYEEDAAEYARFEQEGKVLLLMGNCFLQIMNEAASELEEIQNTLDS